jgi:hypothetical protein
LSIIVSVGARYVPRKVPTMTMTDGVAVDTRLRDLFIGESLMTYRLSSSAHNRYQEALWYSWGRQDAGDNVTVAHVDGSAHLSADWMFAEWAACEAEAFERQYCCWLGSIGSQYARFVAALS